MLILSPGKLSSLSRPPASIDRRAKFKMVVAVCIQTLVVLILFSLALTKEFGFARKRHSRDFGPLSAVYAPSNVLWRLPLKCWSQYLFKDPVIVFMCSLPLRQVPKQVIDPGSAVVICQRYLDEGLAPDWDVHEERISSNPLIATSKSKQHIKS